MYVNQINFNKYAANGTQIQNKPQPAKNYSSGIQTSLYNTKGMNVYFGSLAQGVDVIENVCIDFLRSARNGAKRRFTENDIEDIVKSLRVVKNPEEKPEILQEIVALDEGIPIPDKKLFKNIIRQIADKPENERFAILEFAGNEIENAAKPMEIFSKLPYRTQNNLTKLLCQIDDVNDNRLYKSESAREAVMNSLYDTFRVPLYAHEDLDKIDRAFRGRAKRENLEMLNADLNYYENLDAYKDELAKLKVLSVVENIRDYFNQAF